MLDYPLLKKKNNNKDYKEETRMKQMTVEHDFYRNPEDETSSETTDPPSLIKNDAS